MVIGGSSSTLWEVMEFWSTFVDLIGVNVHINPEKDEKKGIVAILQIFLHVYPQFSDIDKMF